MIAACGPLHAQRPTTTFGLQVKPVIPFSFFETIATAQRENLSGDLRLEGGFAFGMTVRTGITNSISLETGIGQITRRFAFTLRNDTSGYSDQGQVRYIGYEIPLAALVYVRLGERSWMNGSLGGSFDFYPSDAQKDLEYGRVYVYRNRWVQLGLLGNLGVEYRTERSGTFYLGATYHRPFTDMATADLTWYTNTFFPYTMRTTLDGGYLTIDLRYYFHEDSGRRRVWQ